MPRKGPETKRVYRDLVTLGSGGMAKVYKARQEALDRDVAIKELREDLARDPSIVARFEREAKYAAALQHESIVHVYDFFKEEGQYYIVMEFVDGTDLGAILRRTGAVPPEIAAIVLLRLVRALEHAHRHGIIHRDIKPGNVLVSKMGDLKLSDFGIAKEPDPADMKADLTRTGQAIGTPSYMSPEQIVGDPLTFNSDLFAAGIVLYEMLAGVKPFTSDTAGSLLDKILTQGYVDVRTARGGTPRALAKIVRRCLKKEPRKRWRSTNEMRLALEDYVRRNVRAAPEEYLREWLVGMGIFPAPAKPVSNATTNLAGGDAGGFGAVREWGPRLAAGGIVVAGIAAVAFWPGAWRAPHPNPPMPTPPGPLARPSFEATMVPVEAAIAPAGNAPSSTPSSAPSSMPAASPSAAPSTLATVLAGSTALAVPGTPSPTRTPIPTPTPTPSPTPTPLAPMVVDSHGEIGIATSAPSAAPEATPSPRPSRTPRAAASASSPRPSPTPTPRPLPTSAPHASATQTPRATSSATPRASPTSRASATPTPHAASKPAPSPSASPSPTPTPRKSKTVTHT